LWALFDSRQYPNLSPDPRERGNRVRMEAHGLWMRLERGTLESAGGCPGVWRLGKSEVVAETSSSSVGGVGWRAAAFRTLGVVRNNGGDWGEMA
jgi:hypothetical protein